MIRCKADVEALRRSRRACKRGRFRSVRFQCVDARAFAWAPCYLARVNRERRYRQSQGVKVKGVCRAAP